MSDENNFSVEDLENKIDHWHWIMVTLYFGFSVAIFFSQIPCPWNCYIHYSIKHNLYEIFPIMNIMERFHNWGKIYIFISFKVFTIQTSGSKFFQEGKWLMAKSLWLSTTYIWLQCKLLLSAKCSADRWSTISVSTLNTSLCTEGLTWKGCT